MSVLLNPKVKQSRFARKYKISPPALSKAIYSLGEVSQNNNDGNFLRPVRSEGGLCDDEDVDVAEVLDTIISSCDDELKTIAGKAPEHFVISQSNDFLNNTK